MFNTCKYFSRVFLAIAIGVAFLSVPHGVKAQSPSICTDGETTIVPCEAEINTPWITQHGTTWWYMFVQSGSWSHWYYAEPLCDGTYITSCTLEYNYFYSPYYYETQLQYTIESGGYDADPVTVSLLVTDVGSWPYDQVQSDIYLHVGAAPFSLNASINNVDYFSPQLCGSDCFNAAYTRSTVPYYTMDTPRNLTLVYREERAHPRPFIWTQVTGNGNSSPLPPSDVTVRALVNGTYATFTDNSTTIHTSIGSTLGVQLDASTLTSTADVFPVILEVGLVYPDTTTTILDTTTLMVVNPNWFKVAPGWGIAGVQKLTCAVTMGGCLIAEGDGTIVWFSGGVGTQARDYTKLDTTGGYYYRKYLDGSKARFTMTGLMDRLIDSFGRATVFNYDGSGKLVSVQDPMRVINNSGRYAALTYDSNGLTVIADTGGVGSGRYTTLGYTSTRITSITDHDNDGDTLTYDGSGRLSSVIDRRSGVIQYGYDSGSWKLTSLSVPGIPIDNGSGSTSTQTLTTTYTSNGYIPWETGGGYFLSATNPKGLVTNYFTNQYGQPTHMWQYDSTHTYYTDITYQGHLPTSITYPDGSVETTAYSGGLITGHSQPGGGWDSYQYDVNKRLIYSYKAGSLVESRIYNVSGQLDTLLTTTGKFYYSYDATTGQVASVTDSLGHVTRTYYHDSNGNADTTVSSNGLTTILTFDTYGRAITTERDGQPVDTVGYDILNRPTRAVHGYGSDTLAFVYDPLFRIKMVNQKGETIDSIAYNNLGWVTAKRDPNTPTIWETYRYNKIGQLTGMTTRRAEPVKNTYNIYGQQTTHVIPTDSLSFSSDLNNANYSFSNSVSSVFKQYFPNTFTDSVVTSISSGITASVVSFSTSDTLGSIGWIVTLGIYGDTLLPTRKYITDPQTGQLKYMNVGLDSTLFKYKRGGPRDSTFWRSGAVRTEGYSSTSALASVDYASPTAALSRWYKYDALGRFVRITLPNASKQERFAYDSSGQLIAWTRYSGCSNSSSDSTGKWYSNCTTLNDSTAFTYDRTGNRSDNSGSYSTADRMSQFKGYTFTHDSAGRIVQKTKSGVDTRYVWNADNQLTAVINAVSHDTVKFEYDAKARLTKRRSNSTVDRQWLYNGSQILAEFNGGGSVIADYTYEDGIDRPFAVNVPGNGLVFNQIDATGNVIGQHDSTGAVAASMSYDPWGVPIDSTGTLQGSLRWKGLHYESGATIGGKGLYYMRARWYDPELGRFLSEDPLGIDAGYNRYVFAHNNPVNGRDPTGLYSDAFYACRDRMNELYNQGNITVDQWIHGCESVAYELEQVIIRGDRITQQDFLDRLYDKIPRDIIIDLFQQYVYPVQQQWQAADEAAAKAAKLAARIANTIKRCNERAKTVGKEGAWQGFKVGGTSGAIVGGLVGAGVGGLTGGIGGAAVGIVAGPAGVVAGIVVGSSAGTLEGAATGTLVGGFVGSVYGTVAGYGVGYYAEFQDCISGF